MQLTTVVLTGALAVIASAQSSSATKADAPSTTVNLTPAQSSMYACVDECEAGDVECQSRCITVPSPNDNQANATTECVAKCDQGDGSEKETEAYASCVNDCISENFFGTAGTPQATGGSNKASSAASDAAATASASASAASDSAASAASGTATGASTASKTSGSKSTGTSDSESSETASSSGTATASGSEASETNAAPALAVGSVSFLGLVAAVLAL